MRRVQLPEEEMDKDQTAFVTLFVNAAHAQNFDLDWVEDVLFKAIANSCIDFNDIMLDYIEII